jgi:hypothetical protein
VAKALKRYGCDVASDEMQLEAYEHLAPVYDQFTISNKKAIITIREQRGLGGTS